MANKIDMFAIGKKVLEQKGIAFEVEYIDENNWTIYEKESNTGLIGMRS